MSKENLKNAEEPKLPSEKPSEKPGKENENPREAENGGKEYYFVLPDGTVKFFDNKKEMERWIKENRENYGNYLR